jgi:hypothetical protein
MNNGEQEHNSALIVEEKTVNHQQGKTLIN